MYIFLAAILYGFLVLLGLGVAYSIGDFVYKKKFAFSAELLISNVSAKLVMIIRNFIFMF